MRKPGKSRPSDALNRLYETLPIPPNLSQIVPQCPTPEITIQAPTTNPPISPNLSQFVPKSPTSKLARPRILTPLQSRALDLLTTGHRPAQVAAHLQISRRTLSRWINHSPTFRHHYSRRSEQRIEGHLQSLMTQPRLPPKPPTPIKLSELLTNIPLDSPFPTPSSDIFHP